MTTAGGKLEWTAWVAPTGGMTLAELAVQLTARGYNVQETDVPGNRLRVSREP